MFIYQVICNFDLFLPFLQNFLKWTLLLVIRPLVLYVYNFALFVVLIILEPHLQCDMVDKTRVTSSELLVMSWKLKSTSWNSKVWVQIHELRVAIRKLRVQITSYKFRATSSRIIKLLKIQVNNLKITSFSKY